MATFGNTETHHFWLHVHGVWPTRLDHINRNRADNRLANLRPATQSENMANIGVPKHNTSGLKGASWDRQMRKWQAKIEVAGKQIHLGRFESREAAHKAYMAAARRQFGEFARAA